MKRKLLALAALAIVLSLTAVACEDKNEKPADTTAPDAATSAPAEDTSAPAEDTSAPAEDNTTAPTEDNTTAPAEDNTTAPAEDNTTAPAEDETTTPAEDDASGDFSYPFISDVASNENGTDLQESDLFMGFFINYGLGDPHAVADGKYCIGGINELISEIDGYYAYSIVMDSVVCHSGAHSYAFCRGVQDVAFTGFTDLSESVVAIRNFYEDDGASMIGGSGIYATIVDGKLQIVIKYFDATALKGIGNKYYTLNVDSNKLTFADDGNTVYILAGDTLCATIELSGSKDYDEISTTPVASFAETAKITLANGLVDTIENTLITDTHTTQVGIASRVGTTQFSSISIVGFSTVEIPEMVIDSLQVEKNTFPVGQPIHVIANGTATDYVGIYAEDGTLLNKVYLGGDRQINLNTETPLAAGTYTVRFMPNDATDVSAATVVATVKVVTASEIIYEIGDYGSMVSNSCYDGTHSNVDNYEANLKADAITIPAGATTLKLWGWAGFKCETFTFGYIIDDNAPVLKPEFTHVFADTEHDQNDKNAIADVVASAGGIASGRHNISVDLTGLTAGTYTIRAIAQQEDGTLTVLQQFTITIA